MTEIASVLFLFKLDLRYWVIDAEPILSQLGQAGTLACVVSSAKDGEMDARVESQTRVITFFEDLCQALVPWANDSGSDLIFGTLTRFWVCVFCACFFKHTGRHWPAFPCLPLAAIYPLSVFPHPPQFPEPASLGRLILSSTDPGSGMGSRSMLILAGGSPTPE